MTETKNCPYCCSEDEQKNILDGFICNEQNCCKHTNIQIKCKRFYFHLEYLSLLKHYKLNNVVNRNYESNDAGEK